jgi:hypothetical protein
LITAVHYDAKHTHIVEVIAHDTFAGTKVKISRQKVIQDMKNGSKVTTAGKDLKPQADVKIRIINGVEYLRTDNNDNPSDNLGNLPEY